MQLNSVGCSYLESSLGKSKCQKWEWMRPKHPSSWKQQNQLRKSHSWIMITFITRMVIPLFHHFLLSLLDSTSSKFTRFQVCSMTFAFLAGFWGCLQDLSKLFIRGDLSVALAWLPVRRLEALPSFGFFSTSFSGAFPGSSSHNAHMTPVLPSTLEIASFPRPHFVSSFHD